VGAIGRISRNESCLGTRGLSADFAASARQPLDSGLLMVHLDVIRLPVGLAPRNTQCQTIAPDCRQNRKLWISALQRHDSSSPGFPCIDSFADSTVTKTELICAKSRGSQSLKPPSVHPISAILNSRLASSDGCKAHNHACRPSSQPSSALSYWKIE
jgi:hypothetical protein